MPNIQGNSLTKTSRIMSDNFYRIFSAVRSLISLSLFCFFTAFPVAGQSVDNYRFLSYQTLPTWTGIAVDWQQNAKTYLLDARVYKGHASFVVKGLGRKITFARFKVLAKSPLQRQYLPFFVYDLRKQPITQNGVQYNWALRLEDYRYQDSPRGMAETLARLVEMIPPLANNLSPKGLMVLNEVRGNVLNIRALSPFLAKKGLAATTTTQLIAHAGGKKAQVLNGKKALGKLVLVRNKADAKQLTYRSIAVYTYLPERIPPVAGIITLHPQTPLSHVNLLAKNRGTFNMYLTSLEAMPGLGNMFGQLVEIESRQNKIKIAKTSPAKARRFWQANKPVALNIPTPQQKFLEVIPFTKAFSHYLNPQTVGAKAANYGLIYQVLGKDVVRQGFALGFKPYFEVIKQGADQLINRLWSSKKKLSNGQTETLLKAIRDKIKSSKVPAATLQSVKNLIKKYYKGSRIRLRSSTNCEDLPQFNGAGLYKSKGFNDGDSEAKLIKKLLKVYASLWSMVAYAEREYYSIDHRKAGMAILINEAFRKEVANGVILTIPQKQKAAKILVNVQPDEHKVVSPKQGQVPESFLLSTSQTAKVGNIQSRSSIAPVFVGNQTYQHLLAPLKINALKTHRFFIRRRRSKGDRRNYGIDIEFKIMKENEGFKLYFKQARLLKMVLPR